MHIGAVCYRTVSMRRRILVKITLFLLLTYAVVICLNGVTLMRINLAPSLRNTFSMHSLKEWIVDETSSVAGKLNLSSNLQQGFRKAIDKAAHNVNTGTVCPMEVRTRAIHKQCEQWYGSHPIPPDWMDYLSYPQLKELGIIIYVEHSYRHGNNI